MYKFFKLVLPQFVLGKSVSGMQKVVIVATVLAVGLFNISSESLSVITTAGQYVLSPYIPYIPYIKKTRVYGPQAFETYGAISNPISLNIEKSFDGKVTINAYEELPRDIFEKLILTSVPIKMRENVKKYLPSILFYSEKFQLDPLWVTSIMWVESHFKPKARSYVGAFGLMQIMPKTGHYLNKELDNNLPYNVSLHVIKDPNYNIMLGTYYLSRLLERFHGNYTYATVAYNMGPTYTARALRRRRPVGRRNQYLRKVRYVYKKISKPFRQHFALQKIFAHERMYISMR